ncbi:hepatitis A virus cellular receptor 2-like [Astatotilapia calliptera]|uniref:hepatitis A virus cellular receptor 2-like n=1 Tax=Astatotilapia calliptera TaxID=8154 RepID=UPI000E4059E1|nr:hepatitis A virus cellular receptor 2-like [Astatotilapia calliptera]
MIADTGTYECRVFQTETNHGRRVHLKTRPIIINLSVVLPDQKVVNITAESGQNVILPCRAPNTLLIPAVEWSRRDLETQSVLLYWEKGIVTYFQHPSFMNRVDLQDRQMKDGDVSLILKDVTINDTGTYQCRVFMNEKHPWKSIISIINLSVDPPGQTGGHTEDGAVGLVVGLSVSAVLLAVFGCLIYRICKKTQNQGSCQVRQEEIQRKEGRKQD